jgi:hypothetical protein
MPLFRATALVVIFVFAIFASAVSLSEAPAPVPQNANTLDMDRSIKPGDDFYRYANGGWLRTVAIPAGQPSYDTRAMLMEKTAQRVRNLIQDAAAAKPVRGSVTQKVGESLKKLSSSADQTLCPSTELWIKLAAGVSDVVNWC